MEHIEGNIVDIYNRRIYPGEVIVSDGRIISIHQNSKIYDFYICPGFVDAHVHIESSMLTPEEFSRLAIRRGTVAIVNDPHEIANVSGIEGINFMLRNSKRSLVKMFFTIPSCVPATVYDSSGSSINAKEVRGLLDSGNFIGLSEVMDVPGVLRKGSELLSKIEETKKRGLVIDGHAPQLSGKDLEEYVRQGISTDHECTTYAEAVEKIQAGMKILIREGSAAKNYEALKHLIQDYADQLMFCTDDSHPDELIQEGEIDKIVRKAVHDGYDLFDVLKIATLNPVQHYRLDVGTLKEGEKADFVIFEDLKDFQVQVVYINGEKKYDKINFHQQKKIENKEIAEKKSIKQPPINHFFRKEIHIEEISKAINQKIVCIQIEADQIVTQKKVIEVKDKYDNFEGDIQQDILKIVYLNRYFHRPPQVAYIKGMGLKKGAFASSISHDSHNILAVGCNDKDIAQAINQIISCKGGLTIVEKDEHFTLPLPIGGIMTDQSGEEVARQWKKMVDILKDRGTIPDSPFMTLSFMALVVIPELKIGEKGLFEYSQFDFIKNENE